MKILLITMEFPPDRGGVGNYYVGLVSELQVNGLEVKVMVDKNGNRESGIGNHIIPTEFFYKHFWPRWLKLYFQLKIHLKSHHYDYIWVGQILPVGTVVYLLRKQFKLKYFVSTHGLDVLTPQTKARKNKLMKKIFKKAEFVTANSQYTKNELLKLGLADDKVEVIYPGVNESKESKNQENNKTNNQIINKSNKHQPRADRPLAIASKKLFELQDNKILLTVGRLVRRKGQDLVIRALPRLITVFPNLLYVVIGNGPYLNKLRSLAEEFHVADKVLFLTEVDDQEKALYYKHADLFVMPARQIKEDVEGFGIVYLEAMSYGLPVVGARSGGTAEAVIHEQTGLLAEPDNVSDLAKLIAELLSNPDKGQKMVKLGQAMIREKFNYQIQIKKLLTRLNNVS